MIDPALRSTESSGTRQSETSTAPMPTYDTIVIGFTEMELLKSHGYPSAIPFNSPNEGSPLYQVPAAAGVLLQTAETIPVAARQRIGQSVRGHLISAPSISVPSSAHPLLYILPHRR